MSATAPRCPLCGDDARRVNDVLLFGSCASTTWQCIGCASLWRDPMPSDAALRAYYAANDYRYSDDVQRDMAADQARWVTSHLGPDVPSLRVVEYGAGEGWLVAALARHPRVVAAIGIEPDAASVHRASRNGVTVIEGFVGDVSLPRRTETAEVDLVTLVHVLEHLPRPREILASMVTTHGDHLLFIEVPDARFEADAIAETRSRPTSLHQHLFSYTDRGLNALLRGAGYVAIANASIGNPRFWRHYVRGEQIANARRAIADRCAHGQSVALDRLRLGAEWVRRAALYPAARRIGRPELPSLRVLARHDGARSR